MGEKDSEARRVDRKQRQGHEGGVGYVARSVRAVKTGLAIDQDPGHRSRTDRDPANRLLKRKVVETKYAFISWHKRSMGAVRQLIHQGDAWAAAADALRTLHQRMDELPWKIDEADAQEPACDHTTLHVHLYATCIDLGVGRGCGRHPRCEGGGGSPLLTAGSKLKQGLAHQLCLGGRFHSTA